MLRPLLAALVLAGCAETKPSRFYLLSAVPEASRPADLERSAKAAAMSLGVGPVELPKYLDRPLLVRFATPNRLEMSEFDRWAEPLNDNFARVLGENLSVMVPTSQIAVYPFGAGTPRLFERQVLVDVSQFRLNPNGEVELKAVWRVIDPQRRQNPVSGAFATFEPVGSNEAEPVVAAMSRAVATLSRDIAAAIKEPRKRR